MKVAAVLFLKRLRQGRLLSLERKRADARCRLEEIESDLRTVEALFLKSEAAFNASSPTSMFQVVGSQVSAEEMRQAVLTSRQERNQLHQATLSRQGQIRARRALELEIEQMSFPIVSIEKQIVRTQALLDHLLSLEAAEEERHDDRMMEEHRETIRSSNEYRYV
jgi:hypothetical protein